MKDSSARFHFINIVKVTRDFLGEHCSPLTESDCTMLCSHKDMVDGINEALEKAGIEGIKVQLNWSDNMGQTWTQYPKSK